jgi:hypothetical protein
MSVLTQQMKLLHHESHVYWDLLRVPSCGRLCASQPLTDSISDVRHAGAWLALRLLTNALHAWLRLKPLTVW